MNRALASVVCVFCFLFGLPLIAAGVPPVKLQVSPRQQQMVTLSRTMVLS